MKRSVLFPLLLIILIASCTIRRNQYDAVLADIDSLTEVDADSARKRLAALHEEMDGVNKGTRAYYDLLCVKANDKAMVKHTSDSLICEVARYYEANREKGHLPEAYYYVGRANSDMQNGEKALIYFQKALLEDSVHVTTRLKSRIFAQMGYIYLRNGLLEDAISMQQLAHFYCKQIGDTLGIRYCEEDIQTIKALNQALPISEYPAKEMMAKVQKINTLIKSQMLSKENTKLRIENEQNKSFAWGIVLSTTIIAVLTILLTFYFRQKKREAAPQLTPTVKRFYDKDIDHLLATHLHNSKVLKTSDWKTIETHLLKVFPTFKDQLYSLYNFSETEYHICLLIKTEVSPSNMSKLMATGHSAISQSRLRMQQKVFNGEGTAKDWDKFILSL
ncbi:MAG: hypothetical protein K2O61_08455 [Bacteroidaceae bacterium]|nr:hypothetical protein [Bacteroidaceae bacterium]